MSIKGARPNNRQIVPYLFVRNGEEAIRFYEEAFGARVLYRSAMPGGNGIFAQIEMDGSVFQIADESAMQREPNPASPETLGGTTVILERYVPDVDAAFERAVRAGAKPKLRPTNMFFGDRYGWVVDPFGHIWALATVLDTLTPHEIESRMNEALASAKP